MIFLKAFLIGIIFHCVSFSAAESEKVNPCENPADYGIDPRCAHGALPQPEPQQPCIPQPGQQPLFIAQPGYTQLIFPSQCTSCCGMPSNPKPLEPQIQIPFGYTHTPGVGIHKYHPEKKNWNDARKTCVNEGGHLAVISSAEEQSLIHKVSVDSKIADEAWIGLHDLFKKWEWTTVLDVHIDKIGYIKWAPGEPNFADSKEHCVTYKASKNGMNDQNCAGERPFFCEVPMN